MNDRQTAFVHYYLLDPNATQAAISAGYSKKTAYSMGQRLLKNVEVAKAIADGRKEREESTKVDAEFILVNLAAMIKADPCDIIDEDTGEYRRIHEWPLVWRRMLSAADVKVLFEGKGKDQKRIGEIIKYKFIDKLKAFELLGKHIDVQAFKEQLGLSGDADLVDRITASRERQKQNDNNKRMH